MTRARAVTVAAIAAALAASTPRASRAQEADAGPIADAAPADAGPPADGAPAAEPDAAPAPAVEVAAAPASPAPDWSSAPRPDEASGIAVPADRGAQWPRSVGRALLFVPKWALIVVASPVRLAAWSYERYQLRDRFKQVFFNVEGTFGIFPVAFFETGFGFNGGVRLVHKDLFGDEESVRLRAGFGGLYEQIYEIKTGSGRRLGSRFSLELSGRFERRGKDRFYGIGNGDLQGAPDMPLDALGGAAVSSQFRQDVARVLLLGDLKLSGDLSVKLSGALVFRDFDGADDEDENIVDRYDPATLVGFEEGTSNVYSELELRYDSRRRASVLQTEAVDGAGWLISSYAGYQVGFGDDPSAFLRYGADVQWYLDLYRGSRVLALRAMLEGTALTGGEIDEIPFIDLPRLGGSQFLRGYDLDRFRDRVVALSTAEYSYDLGVYGHGFLFVDVGRTYRRPKLDFDDLRVGFGVGMQLHSAKSTLARVHLASSVDGGLFFNISFDPVFERRARAGRL